MSDFLSPAQVAQQLGVEVATLAQWRWRKTGPDYVKVEQLVRYSAEAVEAWVAGGGITT